MQYLQVLISAENKEQANTILDALLVKKLVLGGPIMEAPAKFWWKGEIVEMGYVYILTYTTDKLKQTVIDEYERVSEEEVPMISFMPLEGNKKLLELIDQTLNVHE
jgi:uncharacterized protein involved in tolerance to divalent cations